MSNRRPDWTEDEITLAVCLYYLIESGSISNKSRSHKDLGSIIGRSEKSIGSKLSNIQFCDNRKTGGYSNINKLDKIVFEKYLHSPDKLFAKCKEILERMNLPNDFSISDNAFTRPNPYLNLRILDYEDENTLDLSNNDFTGKETTSVVKIRQKQWAFRQSLLSNYEHKCCLSEISSPQLLIASHIVPWAQNDKLRLDPRNGLILNSLLDRAFDKGLITINPNNYKVIISDKIKDSNTNAYLATFENKEIILPKNKNVWPLKENLQYHNDTIFNKFKENDNVSDIIYT